jgi:hypothetical protein
MIDSFNRNPVFHPRAKKKTFSLPPPPPLFD